MLKFFLKKSSTIFYIFLTVIPLAVIVIVYFLVSDDKLFSCLISILAGFFSGGFIGFVISYLDSKKEYLKILDLRNEYLYLIKYGFKDALRYLPKYSQIVLNDKVGITYWECIETCLYECKKIDNDKENLDVYLQKLNTFKKQISKSLYFFNQISLRINDNRLLLKSMNIFTNEELSVLEEEPLYAFEDNTTSFEDLAEHFLNYATDYYSKLPEVKEMLDQKCVFSGPNIVKRSCMTQRRKK